MSENKRAFITGINGQDGSYLAELLLTYGYEVWGIVKRNSVSENQTSRIEHLRDKAIIEYGDMLDMASLVRVLQRSMPDEIYNLAAQSHVRVSFEQPIYTTKTIVIGTMNLLETAKMICPDAKIYQASSSEMFGNPVDDDGLQRESTKMLPNSPYGCSKLYAYNLCRVYRQSYNMFISNGILFNHESIRRGLTFVTNKVIKAAVDIKKGLEDELPLGNLDAYRDWGHAKDYVRAMHMIVSHDEPDDFVCATGQTRSVRELCDYVFSSLGMNYENYVVIRDRYIRPFEVEYLKGDSTKLKDKLGWSPRISFEQMIDEMIKYWLNR